MDDPLQIVPDPPRMGPLLLKDMALLVLFGPPMLALILCGSADPSVIFWESVANYVPFIGFTASFWVLFAYLLPWFETKLPTMRTNLFVRLPLLSAFALLIALFGASVLGRIHHIILGLDFGESNFYVISSSLCIVLGLTLDYWIRARRRLIYSEQLREVEQRARVLAQLRALEARTQPHFLFNTLNTIASLIRDDPDLAERTVEQTAELLRYVVEAPKRSLVMVAEELRLVSNYLSIQEARFGRRFEWAIDVDEAAMADWIPPMSLQPLVENAMLHGLTHRRRDGLLKISLQREGTDLVCRVLDNGPDAKPSKKHLTRGGTGTSLNELRQRLSLLFGDDASLSGAPTEQGGFMAVLRVPERSPA